MLFRSLAFLLFFLASFEVYSFRQKFTLDLMLSVHQKKENFGFSYGTTGSLLFRPSSFLETGLSLSYLGIPVHKKPTKHVLSFASLIPIRTIWSPMKVLELQAFLEGGAQMLLGGGDVALGPVAAFGLGMQYHPKKNKAFALNFDLVYQLSWTKLETTLRTHSEDNNGLLSFNHYPIKITRLGWVAAKIGVSY